MYACFLYFKKSRIGKGLFELKTKTGTKAIGVEHRREIINVTKSD